MNITKLDKNCIYCQKKVPKNRKIYCSYECSWREYKKKNKEKIYKQWREYYERRKGKEPKWLKSTYEKRKINEPNYWEKRKKYGKISRAYLRKDVLTHYGGKCECCGEIKDEFLTIDHINKDGAKHRKETNGHVYRWLRKNKYPSGFRILCFNCNCSLGFHGYCPHKEI